MRGRPVRTIEVALGDRSYPVHIESGLLARAGEFLAPLARGKRPVLVSDETVWALQGERLNFDLQPILLPPGEGSKSWAALEALVDRLLAHGVERGDPIIAFGGGVIGDLAGFAAAIVKRGCPLVQIPTTLLAQVDSSVGGKTGINSAAGKNMVGAFHQPSLVLIDPDCLDTLPPRELRAGYAELVKYGLLGDADFFAWCEANGRKLLEGGPAAREHAIATCVAAKAAIVADDERETTGRRALLNLGHTFAHALEAETGLSDTLLHGEAVALGLVLAFRLSAERGLCSGADADRVAVHLECVGLPARLEIGSGASLTAHMAKDKKARDGRVPLILVRGIGQAFVDDPVTLDEVADFLDRQRQMALVTG
jgi:3-dehydroquinate synthase